MIKEEHPEGMIDLKLVKMSMVIEGKILKQFNEIIFDEFGEGFELNKNNHILLIDLGEKD